MFTMKNQKGVGLVQVVLAAALVVVIALVVASVVSNQNTQSKKVETSATCKALANSVAEYLKKNESSFSISSYGPMPGTTRFASGLDKTEDGLDKFVFSGNPIQLFSGPANNRISLPNGNQIL